jgi:hypothetical protein
MPSRKKYPFGISKLAAYIRADSEGSRKTTHKAKYSTGSKHRSKTGLKKQWKHS